jgi:HSP20 family protein
VFLFPQRDTQEWQPALDIYRAAGGWILKFDLAGVRIEDVHVHIGKRSVTVNGVRRDSMLEEAGCCHYSMEISYSRFERTIELPDNLDTAKFRLDYRDGILFVRISVRNDKEE